MESISQFELEKITGRAASGSLANVDRRSADRRPDLTPPQLAQLVGFLLAVEEMPVLPCIVGAWPRKRQRVIENWCEAHLNIAALGPRNASQFSARRTMLPPLPCELAPLAAAAIHFVGNVQAGRQSAIGSSRKENQ